MRVIPFVFLATRVAAVILWALLLSPNPEGNGGYGKKVKMSNDGNYLLVSAPQESANGRAYLYKRDTDKITYTLWSTINGASGDYGNFGKCLGITAAGSYFIIGTLNKVYVYKNTAQNNTPLTQTLTVASVNFGADCDMNGSTNSKIVVGGDEYDTAGNAQVNVGRVYPYRWNGTTFAAMPVIDYPATLASFLYFGKVVALSSDGMELAVGAPSASSSRALLALYYGDTALPLEDIIDDQAEANWPSHISMNCCGTSFIAGNNSINRLTFFIYSGGWVRKQNVDLSDYLNSVYISKDSASRAEIVVAGAGDKLQVYKVNATDTLDFYKTITGPSQSDGFGITVSGSGNYDNLMSLLVVGAPDGTTVNYGEGKVFTYKYPY